MWGQGFVHGLGGGLGLPFGAGRLPPPKAVDGSIGEESSLEPELSVQSRGWKFPLKAGITSGGLALVGDTIAQFYGRFESQKSLQRFSSRKSVRISIFSLNVSFAIDARWFLDVQ